jgi:hypothetical protein
MKRDFCTARNVFLLGAMTLLGCSSNNGKGGSGGVGGAAGPGGVTGWAGGPGGAGGLAGTQGGYAGFAGAFAGANGTGSPPVDASVPNPWSYRGQPVTKIDVKRCRPYDGCDVCTLTLGSSGDAAVPNLDYGLPSPICSLPPADAGTSASSSLVEHQAGPIPPLCGLVAPDGGISAMITEIVLQPNGDAESNQSGFPNAYCQFLPGPTIAEPDGCLLQTLSNDEFCVSDCSECP